MIAVISAIALLGLGLLAVGFVLGVTRTRFGQEQVRKFIATRLAPAVRGKCFYMGKIDLSHVLSRVAIDSVAVCDKSDSLFFASGRIEAGYDWRDLSEFRIALHNVIINHPYLHLRQHANGEWNFNEVIREGKPSYTPQPANLSWGQYVVLDSLRVHDATFVLSQPWTPDDTLRGAARDANILFELARTDHIIRRTADGFDRTYTWGGATAYFPYIRLFDPDSDKKAGKEIRVGELRVDESDPPFDFRHVSGSVRIRNDSLLLDIRHFDLPASTGSGRGAIWWGHDHPVQYDIAIRGDSVSLDDVNWVYPALPRTGGGRTLLSMKTERIAHDVAFRLDSMDMRTTRSHLTGTMTFVTGEPVLTIRDLNLVADPIDFDFIRTLNGRDFPNDWRGQLFGTVQGAGGPLTQFVVGDLHGEWRDTHVPGAVSRVSGHGGLNILEPANASFNDFQVDVGSLDLRSIEYLFPSFPPLGGTISGTATLDSSWLDVRFRDADIVHRDGPGEPTYLTGEGRVTWGSPYMIYDVALNAAPISLDISLPATRMHGLFTGPIRAQGTSPDLMLATKLSGAAGSFSFDGRVSIDSVAGYGAHGQGEILDLDVQRMLGDIAPKPATLSGHYDADFTLTTLVSLAGTASVDLERSEIDSMPVSALHANVRFAAGDAHLADTLRITSPAGVLAATGGIGLPHGPNDSLRLMFATSSVPSWRRYLFGTPIDSVVADSVVAHATVAGRVDAFGGHGTLEAQHVALGADTAFRLHADFALDDPILAWRDAFSIELDTVRLGSFHLGTLSGDARFSDSTHATFAATGAADRGRALHLEGAWARMGGSQEVRLDRALLNSDSTTQWHLRDTTTLRIDSAQMRLGVLTMVNDSGGSVSLAGVLPDSASASVDVTARGVSLREIDRLLQGGLGVDGVGDLTAHLGGTRARPEIGMALSLRQPEYAGVRLDSLTSRGGYRDTRIDDTIAVFETVAHTANHVVATVQLPFDLSHFGFQPLQDAPVAGRIEGDSVDLSLLQALIPGTMESTTGSIVFATPFTLSGTMRRPRFSVDLRVHNGQTHMLPLGSVVLSGIHGEVRLSPNGIEIDSLLAKSGSGRGEHSASFSGFIGLRSDRELWSQIVTPDSLNLTFRAVDFAAFNTPSVARLNIGTPGSSLSLRGPIDAALLSGTLSITSGEIYLPDPKVAAKDATGQSLAESDTSDGGSAPTKYWAPITTLINGMQYQANVALGDNVALKSFAEDPEQANVKLKGVLSVQRPTTILARTDQGSSGLSYPLALQGTLNALGGGTYTLTLAPGVARTFIVLNSSAVASTITFDGSPGLNPTLDISAAFDVKVFAQPDVDVIAHLTGPLRPAPTLTFRGSSAGGTVIDQSDLLSYLIDGKPDYFANNPDAGSFLVGLLGPSISSYASGLLGNRFQGVAGRFSVEAGTSDATQKFNLQNDPRQVLGSTRFGLNEWQVKGNVYLTLSSGLCSFVGAQPGATFSQSFGGEVEYRIGSYTRFEAGLEPSTQALLCSSSELNLPGLAPTPKQFSLSFLHTIRW